MQTTKQAHAQQPRRYNAARCVPCTRQRSSEDFSVPRQAQAQRCLVANLKAQPVGSGRSTQTGAHEVPGALPKLARPTCSGESLTQRASTTHVDQDRSWLHRNHGLGLVAGRKAGQIGILLGWFSSSCQHTGALATWHFRWKTLDKPQTSNRNLEGLKSVGWCLTSPHLTGGAILKQLGSCWPALQQAKG